MGEWKAVFDGEVEGRPVVVKIYDSEDDETEDGEPVYLYLEGLSNVGRWLFWMSGRRTA